MMRLLFLGTGASAGIPAIGCCCEVCRSKDPHNRRLRTSAVIQAAGKTLLIDAGPDLRAQALQHHIHHIDGVLFTHTHYDHTGGIDELRSYFFKTQQPVLCLLSETSMIDLQRRFYYLFDRPSDYTSLTTRLSFQVLQEERGTTDFVGLKIGYMTYHQGGMPVNGFRIGDLAYLSDIYDYHETIFDDLKNVKTLVISALRHDPSPVHFTVAEAVAFAKRVGAEQTWLTHIAHDLDHTSTNVHLPSSVQLAYDGLTIPFNL